MTLDEKIADIISVECDKMVLAGKKSKSKLIAVSSSTGRLVPVSLYCPLSQCLRIFVEISKKISKPMKLIASKDLDPIIKSGKFKIDREVEENKISPYKGIGWRTKNGEEETKDNRNAVKKRCKCQKK